MGFAADIVLKRTSLRSCRGSEPGNEGVVLGIADGAHVLELSADLGPPFLIFERRYAATGGVEERLLVNPAVSTTSVSPSHRPTEGRCRTGRISSS